jgi:hypothetical protein
MGIRYDRSDETVIMVCDCGWRSPVLLLSNNPNLTAEGDRHILIAHAGDTRARNAWNVRKLRQRQ